MLRQLKRFAFSERIAGIDCIIGAAVNETCSSSLARCVCYRDVALPDWE
jgi:hypothetical protein